MGKHEFKLNQAMTFWEAWEKLTPEQRAANEQVVIGAAKMNELQAAYFGEKQASQAAV